MKFYGGLLIRIIKGPKLKLIKWTSSMRDFILMTNRYIVKTISKPALSTLCTQSNIILIFLCKYIVFKGKHGHSDMNFLDKQRLVRYLI